MAAQVRKVGLQLYTVRELFQRDPVATLEKVARIGYREVEFGGGNYEAMDHALLRRTMDKLHLSAPSLHVPYETLLTKFAEAVKMAKALGADTIVVPWLPEELRTDTGFGAVVENMNRFAKQARDAGLGLAYHNHDFEFTTRFDGKSLYDRLVSGTDPALVKLELDLFWAVHAGEDPGKLVDRLAARLYAFHVKDMRADKSMTAVGTGTIDFAALFKRPGAASVRHFYVENDEAPAPYLPDITTSFRNLSALRF
ncbi:sugar phosphate isomerase/epimerase family protein [Sphingomonas sp. EC-HK361]|uniref:sugar phosphate isomerase/epimerase family protein n=1 Tax=Sphingomonas sp. EC-HK361 TaxID=2038397 RepID=UPI001F26BD89|nr:sugar phosphate isomerase/epimerase [Sphingomonas sp. EC-HK361]